MDRGAWWAIAHKAAKSWTQLKQLSTHARDLLVVLRKNKWGGGGACIILNRAIREGHTEKSVSI